MMNIMNIKRILSSVTCACIFVFAPGISNAEYHVSITGDDSNAGSRAMPLKTISAAAAKAQSGDVITVHQGIYRERINPPRGGTSDDKRIVYQAAAGEKVVIKGSERVAVWKKIEKDRWMVARDAGGPILAGET